MRTDVFESLALGVAQLVERERELLLEVDKVRAQKAEKIARMRAMASNEQMPLPPHVASPEGTSKRERVRAYIASFPGGATVTNAEIAHALGIDANVVSTYLGQFKGVGMIEPAGRGRYRVLIGGSPTM